MTPALLERDWIQVSRLLEGYLHYDSHFVYPFQCLVSPWGYGLSLPGPVSGMSFALRPAHLLLGTVARALHPDVILMDVRMPNCDGLAATRLIQAEMPECKIVMPTTSAEDADRFEAIKSGATGYLLKNLEPNDLFDYLAGLSRGDAQLSRELSARLLREFAQQAAALDEQAAADLRGGLPAPVLTPRQREILVLVADILSYKEVGAALNLSEHTVRYHMGEVLQRLHLKNREQVVAYARRSGLAP